MRRSIALFSFAPVMAAIAILPPTVNAAQDAPGLAPEPAVSRVTEDNGGARIVVRYKDGMTRAGVAIKLDAVQAAAQRAGLGNGAAVRAGKAAGPAALQAELMRTLAVGAEVIGLSRSLDEGEMQRLLQELSADPAVVYAVPDRLARHEGGASAVQPQWTPNDQFYQNYQWHLHHAVGGIKAPAAWASGARGEGVVVAVLDTGILPEHPDLRANLLPGYDFITDRNFSRRPANGRVPGALDYGDWTAAGDCYQLPTPSPATNSTWHGTHVAGTIAESTDNAIGMAGVAHKAMILPVRVLGRCGGFESDISDAIVWAAGGQVAGVPANTHPAEVINMSLSGNGGCAGRPFYQEAIDIAVARGTTVVVAAGNQTGDAASRSPASCAKVITVAATRISGARAAYSNYGAAVELAAPGGGGAVDGNPNGYVWQSGYNGLTTPTSGNYTYQGKIGTSMATPHVAGVVALVQGARVAAGMDPLPPARMEALLMKTARAFPVTPDWPIGAGILDAERALEVGRMELSNKVRLTLSGAAGQERLYRFEARAGAVLSVLTYGGTGNVSLYASFEKEPTAASFDAKSTRQGNNETLRFTAPRAGTYYLKLVSEEVYNGVTLEVRQ